MNEKKLLGNHTRMLYTGLNKSWKHYSKTFAGHYRNHRSISNKICWAVLEKSEHTNDVLLWILSKSIMIKDWHRWRERFKGIHIVGMLSWWWFPNKSQCSKFEFQITDYAVHPGKWWRIFLLVIYVFCLFFGWHVYLWLCTMTSTFKSNHFYLNFFNWISKF